MSKRRVVIHISLSQEMLDLLNEYAKKDKRTRSDFIREAVRFYIVRIMGGSVYDNHKKS